MCSRRAGVALPARICENSFLQYWTASFMDSSASEMIPSNSSGSMASDFNIEGQGKTWLQAAGCRTHRFPGKDSLRPMRGSGTGDIPEGLSEAAERQPDAHAR